MIDTVALAWGHAIGSEPRRADAPKRGRRAEPKSPPIRLDVAELVDRLGSDEGEVRAIRYGDAMPTFGHWKVGDVELLYRDGRVELRASLPKLLTGRNDVVLDERGVHDGLQKLVHLGVELARHPLELREADPVRLDYAYQWQVPSVAHVLEHVKSAFHASRKLRSEHVSPKGGRSLVWGYGSKRVIRFYDKVGELAARGEDSEHELDTLLRYEIQERRRPNLRLVHEQGYTAAAVRGELVRGVHILGAAAMLETREFLREQTGSWPAHGFAYGVAALHLAEHDELWPVVRDVVSSSAFYRWRGRAREAALDVADWTPAIPDDAFASTASMWFAPPHTTSRAA